MSGDNLILNKPNLELLLHDDAGSGYFSYMSSTAEKDKYFMSVRTCIRKMVGFVNVCNGYISYRSCY